jgi:hypothetical protein
MVSSVRVAFLGANDHVMVRSNRLATTFRDEDFWHCYLATLRRSL